MKVSFLSILLLISFTAFSQKSDFGSWNVINTELTLSEKWSLFNELQLRTTQAIEIDADKNPNEKIPGNVD